MEAKTVKEVLIAARWIQDRFDLAKGAMYRNKANAAISGFADFTKVCMLGAIEQVKADCDLRYQAEVVLRRQIFSDTNGHSIVGFSDSHTKQEVLALYDRVIANL